MIGIINSFLESNYYNKLNPIITKKIFKIFKIFFVLTNLKVLPEKNYSFSKNRVIDEFENGKKFKKIKPYITYTHLLDLITVMNKQNFSFFDYGAGNLNLFFFLSNKFEKINYFFYDQKNIMELCKDFLYKNKLNNLKIDPVINDENFDIVYFGSSLQYLKNYKEEIMKFNYNSQYLLISQTPFFKNENINEDFIILKQINMHPNINFLYSFNYDRFINFMRKNNFILIGDSLNRVTKFLNFKNFKNKYKNIDMYDLLFKKI